MICGNGRSNETLSKAGEDCVCDFVNERHTAACVMNKRKSDELRNEVTTAKRRWHTTCVEKEEALEQTIRELTEELDALRKRILIAEALP